jgi:hypothetical protein
LFFVRLPHDCHALRHGQGEPIKVPALTLLLGGEAGARLCSETRFSKLVGVAVVHFDLDPIIFDGLIQPSAKIGVSYVHEMIAPKHSMRTNAVFHEDAEDLSANLFIRRRVIEPPLLSSRRSHRLNSTATRGKCAFRTVARKKFSDRAML